MRKQLLWGILTAASLTAAWAQPTATKIIDNGPDTDKKVIAIIGDGYGSGEQTKYQNDVKRLFNDGVFANDFFRENENAFNVYRINLVSTDSRLSNRTYTDPKNTPTLPGDDVKSGENLYNTGLKYVYTNNWAHCWMEEQAETPTLRANALKAVSRYDYVVVLLDTSGFGGCGGGGMQVVTAGVGWDVLAHEYGHGIGGLMDEYSVGNNYTGTVNGINCTTKLNRTDVFWERFLDPTTPLPTATGGGDPNRRVGAFTGCATYSTGIYRPVENCRMNGNTPPYCPICHTQMMGVVNPKLAHDFSHPITGDFSGDGRDDLLLHNYRDFKFYTANSRNSFDFTWAANNLVPGPTTWTPSTTDNYLAGDFDNDGKKDLYVINLTDWGVPYLGMLKSLGTSFQTVARYDGSIGTWTLKPKDQFFMADFDGDKKMDLYVFNPTDWGTPKLGLLKSNGNSLSVTAIHTSSIPGWSMTAGDKFYPGDFDADGKTDLYVQNGTNWGTTVYVGMLKSSGTSLSDIKLFTNSLPGWSMTAGDQIYVGDFDNDKRADLIMYNETNWAWVYMHMIRSLGTDLAFVQGYNNSSASSNIPGWNLTKGDHFYLADADKNGRADLFSYNSTVAGAERLGTLLSSGTSFSGSYIQDWVGGFNMGPSDKFIPLNYEGGAGKADLIVYNNSWMGVVRKPAGTFVQDRLYYKWIYSALYDQYQWSDGFPQ